MLDDRVCGDPELGGSHSHSELGGSASGYGERDCIGRPCYMQASLASVYKAYEQVRELGIRSRRVESLAEQNMNLRS